MTNESRSWFVWCDLYGTLAELTVAGPNLVRCSACGRTIEALLPEGVTG